MTGNVDISHARLIEPKEELDEFIEMEKLSVNEGDSKLSITHPAQAKDRFAKKTELLSKRVHDEFQNKAEKVLGDSLFKGESSPDNDESQDSQTKSRSRQMNKFGSMRSIQSPDRKILEPIEETNYRLTHDVPVTVRGDSRSHAKPTGQSPQRKLARKRSISSDTRDKQKNMARKGIGSPKVAIGKYNMVGAKMNTQSTKLKTKVKVTLAASSEAKLKLYKSAKLDSSFGDKDSGAVKNSDYKDTKISGKASGIGSKEGSAAKMSTEELLAPLNNLLHPKVVNKTQPSKLVQQKSLEIKLTSASPQRSFLRRGDGQALKNSITPKNSNILDNSAVLLSSKTIPYNIPPRSVVKGSKTSIGVTSPTKARDSRPQSKAADRSTAALQSKPAAHRQINTHKSKDSLPSDMERRSRPQGLDDSGYDILKKASCKLLPNIDAKDLVNDSFNDILLKDATLEQKASVKRLGHSSKLTLHDALQQTSLIVKEHFNQRREKVLILNTGHYRIDVFRAIR